MGSYSPIFPILSPSPLEIIENFQLFSCFFWDLLLFSNNTTILLFLDFKCIVY